MRDLIPGADLSLLLAPGLSVDGANGDSLTHWAVRKLSLGRRRCANLGD